MSIIYVLLGAFAAGYIARMLHERFYNGAKINYALSREATKGITEQIICATRQNSFFNMVLGYIPC